MTEDTHDIVGDFLVRFGDGSPHLAEVRRGLASGTCTAQAPERDVSCEQLLEIYRARAAHLATLKSLHAASLRVEVLGLCRMLELHRLSSARVWIFRCDAGVSIVAFQDVADQVLLGCLRSYDKTRVEPTRWTEIWGTNIPNE
jgi:hypothetical protein